MWPNLSEIKICKSAEFRPDNILNAFLLSLVESHMTSNELEHS